MKGRIILCWFVVGYFVTCGRGEAVSQINFWEQTNGPYGGNVGDLAINGRGHIFATTMDGVFRSTDNGASWTKTGLRTPPFTPVNALAINAGGIIFAGGNGGVVRSTDNGASWTETTAGLTDPHVVGALAINAGGTIFVGTLNEYGSGGVSRSTDNGASWITIGLANTYAFGFNAIGNIFAGGWSLVGGCVFISTDSGASWTKTGLRTPSLTPVTALAINAAGNIFAGTSGGGVFRSTDNGASWTNTGLTNTYVTAFAINASGHVFAGTFGGGVYHSTDNGSSWAQINAGLTYTSVAALAINASGTIFAGTPGGGVFRSVQSTTSEREISAEIPIAYSLNQNYPNPFNPVTKIQFSIITSQFTILKVFDVVGREVATLVNEVKEPGTYDVEFDATGLASAMYLYKLQAGSFSSVKKMMMLK